MSRQDRAKQFMPFAALKGYEEALAKKEKIIVAKSVLSEDYKEVLDRKLLQVRRNDIITVIHYHQGEYLKTTGMVSRIDYNSRYIKVVNTKIYFDDLYDIVLQ
ncbi:MAG: YolD-like family protein [Clostridiales bacterium]|nr:YolD-like family protein [Clostridiales bacterium]